MATVSGVSLGGKPTVQEVSKVIKKVKLAVDPSEAGPKDKESPASTSVAYDIMKPRWDKIDAVLGGTESMRSAGESYLPVHTEESAQAYKERLMCSTLFNMSEMTLDHWVGQPFSEPVKIPEDMPDLFKEYCDDIDLQGNNLTVFARNWFREGLAKAFSHVLVEFPKVNPINADGSPRTLAQDQAQNVRPYLVKIAPENLIFAHAETIDGRETLTQIRIRESIVEMDGFVEVRKEQIRVITPGKVDIYRKIKNASNKEVWAVHESYTYDFPTIPLVTFYANREGLMLGKPPLTDIVDLNIAHWQSTSDQRSILTVARFPMLALSGGGNLEEEQKAQVVVSPHQYLFCPDPQGKYYYVEHSGNAIDSGRQDLQDLETQMASYGAEYLKKKPGSQTATARALDSAEATSPLQDAALRFNDALNAALDLMGQWVKLAEIPDVEIETDFNSELTDQTTLTTIQAARTNRDISRKAFLEEMKKRKVLSDDYDIEGDLAELENEVMTGAATLDLMTGSGNGTENPQ